MKTTAQLLEELRVKLGFSYYKLALHLGVIHTAMSKYRNGRIVMGDELALRVAAELDLDPGLVLTWVHAERALRLEQRDVYKVLEQFARRVAAVALMAGVVGVSLPSPEAHATQQSGSGAARSVYYVKSRRSKNQLLGALLRIFCMAGIYRTCA